MGIILRIHVRVSGEMQHRIEQHASVKTAAFGDVIEIELQDSVTTAQANTLITGFRNALVEVKQPG